MKCHDVLRCAFSAVMTRASESSEIRRSMWKRQGVVTEAGHQFRLKRGECIIFRTAEYANTRLQIEGNFGGFFLD